MGAARKRKEAFLREHSLCCFCGGGTPATTIDHVPLRAAFAGGIGPENFEFPACAECNSGTSGSEQVFALYIRLLDRNDENFHENHVRKLILGVANNYPDLLPDFNISAAKKKRVLDHWGFVRPISGFSSDASLFSIPKAANDHIEINSLKLLAALHYRHMGSFVNADMGVFFGWTQQGLPGSEEAKEILFDGMSKLVVGRRVNTSIGDQFAYRWGFNPGEDLFGIAAGFGAGMMLMAACAPWKVVSEIEDWRRFSPPRSP